MESYRIISLNMKLFILSRPKGCKTIFVGGLPENITQEIIQEIFERCGEITTLRLSKKNFCHIRFSFEASVDSAIYLSGYRVKINNSNEPGNTGKLHVDFAQARDDQYEYECKQRQLIREMRHKEKARGSSASPPLTTHYTDHEASVIAEKLKSDETFLRSVQTLIAWLEKGDCNKKNSNVFYSMIQSTNSHTRRLFNEKNQFEDELKDAKEKYQRQMMKMVEQCK
jgi:RNA recognition motif-containing protein